MIRSREIIQFPYGQIDTITDDKIPEGAASMAKDWIPQGDRIELRRGYLRMGSDEGIGRVSGFHVTQKADGTQIMYKKIGRKLKYYDEVTSDWIETGTDLFPAAAENDDASFDNYASLAGNQMFISSPNSGLYKVMTANPASYTDLTNTAKNFAGYIKAYFNRLILWFRNKDKTGIYGSYIDNQQYTTVSAEALTDVASGTLAFKSGGSTRTCFGVQITLTSSGEIFTDDYNGILTGSLGNTGTINYTSGAYTTTASGAGTADYQWEDSNNQGLGDFTKSGTRTAGQGFIFRQDDGGGSALGVGLYNAILYCIHVFRAWELTITTDDTNATNLPYRDQVGISNHWAFVSTERGIYYIDDKNQSDPQLKILSLETLSNLVKPKSISKKTVKGIILGVDLSGYVFDQAAMIEWGDYIVVACRSANSSVNNKVLLYNQQSDAFSWHNYSVSCFGIYNGLLMAGDSVTKNVYNLFSGWDDDDSNIVDNSWETELSKHGIEELKKTKKIILRGLISVNQGYDVYANTDNNNYVLIGSISGQGSYVDRGQSVSIGSAMLGSQTVGGSSFSSSAYNYEHALRLGLSKYKRIKLKFVATGIGYVSVNAYKFWKITLKGDKQLSKYR